jgi:hypothetical protein
LHHQSIWAFQDLLYLQPQHRRGRNGMDLIAFSEADMKSEGVQVVSQYSTQHRDLSPLLARMGYSQVASFWAKEL